MNVEPTPPPKLFRIPVTAKELERITHALDIVLKCTTDECDSLELLDLIERFKRWRDL